MRRKILSQANRTFLIRRRLLTSVIVFFVMFLQIYVQKSFATFSVKASSITPSRIILETNEVRLKYGLPELKVNQQLVTAAYAKGQDMLAKQYWSHFGPNGESPWDFMHAAGYTYVFAGENLAKGFVSSEGVVNAWMNSPTHRENILSNRYQEIGVAVVTGELNGVNTTIVIQMFGNTTREITSPAKEFKGVLNSKNKENGDIKAIKIARPKNGVTVTDPFTEIYGSTKGVDEYTLQFIDSITGEMYGEYIGDSGQWTFRPQKPWKEGENIVKINLDENINKILKFTLDSRGPVLTRENISIQDAKAYYSVAVQFPSQDSDVSMASIAVNGKNIEMLNKGSNSFTADIPIMPSDASVLIIAQDVHGNVSMLDISDLFPRRSQGGMTNLLGGMITDSSFVMQWVGSLSIFIILLLLIIEVRTYYKHQLLHYATYEILGLFMFLAILIINHIFTIGGGVV